MEIVRETAETLRSEAAIANERRMLVASGDGTDRGAVVDAVADAVAGDTVVVSERNVGEERFGFDRTGELLGTTRECVVVDCHDTYRPNAIGRATGAVDGGGLFVLLTPPLERWPETDGAFDELLAPPPFSAADAGTRFKRRLTRTLSAHRGIAIVDVDEGTLLKRGRTDPPRRPPRERVSPPDEHAFPTAAYEACLTADQRDALSECERLAEPGTAVVLKSDRGRGKSSAAGLAAAAFAAGGSDVLVSAPDYRNAAALFERAADLLEALGELRGDDRNGGTRPALRTERGTIRFLPPTEATDAAADVLFVDEAAALPVRTLESLVSVASSVCFATTVRGYEGTGRGFDVRFRGRLDELCDCTECVLSEPIRYASGDPIEVWQFHALCLGATPTPAQLVEGVDADDAVYERVDRDALAANEAMLRELFGLLVAAHYRTEPDDLARLLDAPNVAVRALTVDGHPVSVALLSREGGLEESTRRRAYEGERIRGNLLPDLLTSQLRDPEAGDPVGLRVRRIATHRAARGSGLGSRLLSEIEAEFRADRTESDRFGGIDYLGVSYGATPRLLSFWTANGYRTIHLSTTRNESSGEHSAVMVRPLTAAGRELSDRHAAWFRRRIPSVLSGALVDVDPDVVRGALAAVEGTPPVELTDFEWRLVASAAYGPGQYDTAPGPFRRLALRALVDGALDAESERLLAVKVLQGNDWDETVERLGYVSRRECMRQLGSAYRPIVDRYGGETAREEADRYR
jgi:tRNA(Met) cytidine acetyltransferase